jgi:hypothetical protein
MTSQEQNNYDEALEGACLFEALQNTRGVHPMKIAASAAMLIGKIIGAASNDEAHVQQGLEHLIKIMNVCAADWLAAQQVKH